MRRAIVTSPWMRLAHCRSESKCVSIDSVVSYCETDPNALFSATMQQPVCSLHRARGRMAFSLNRWSCLRACERVRPRPRLRSRRKKIRLIKSSPLAELVPPKMEEIFLNYRSEERPFTSPIGNVAIKPCLHGFFLREESFDLCHLGCGDLSCEAKFETC